MQTAEDTETALITRLQALRAGEIGETLSLEQQTRQLFERHHPHIVAYCKKRVGRMELAQELASQTLEVAWRRLDTFEGQSPFVYWLLGIARNLCLNKRARRADVLVDDGVLDPGSFEIAVWSVIDGERRREVLLAAIGALPPLEQEVVVLRYFEGLPLAEIEAELDLGIRSGARGVLVRVRRHLRVAIREIMATRDLHTSFFIDR